MKMRRVLISVFISIIVTGAFFNSAWAKTKYLKESEVSKTMIEFTKALGVKCNFCHVSERSKTYKALGGQTADAQELGALVHQRIARAMLGTMLYINKTEGKNLTCNSCHQGKAEVETVAK